MNKKNIGIIVGIIIAAIIIVLLVLFGSKKEVTFDSVGGTEVATQEVRFFSKATKPADPTREGYVFDNWYLDDKEYDFDKRVTKDIKLVARWSKPTDPVKKFTVKFSTGEGSEVEPIEVEADGIIKKPADPTRKDYRFVAWQYNGKDFDFNTKVTKDMTLTAKWEKENSNEEPTKPNKPVVKPDPTPEDPVTPEEPVVDLTKYTVSCVTINDNQCEIRAFDPSGKQVSATVSYTTVKGKTGSTHTGSTMLPGIFASGKVTALN